MEENSFLKDFVPVLKVVIIIAIVLGIVGFVVSFVWKYLVPLLIIAAVATYFVRKMKKNSRIAVWQAY